MNTILRKRVAIIGTNGLPAQYGGFETLVANIHESISEHHDLTVYCSNKTQKGVKSIGKTRLFRIPLSANGWQSFFYDFISIFHAIFIADVLIILGLGGGLALPILSFTGKKLIYNPGGVETDKVRGSKITGRVETMLKRFFDHGFYKLSKNIVLDNEAFFPQLDVYSDKLILIEYGGEDSSLEQKVDWKSPFEEYDISVSRAQEDMNIHLVLEAYTKSSRNLIMISNWGTSEYGQSLFSKFHKKFSNIFLHEAVYEKSKLNCMRSGARLYVHSHMLCGTAPSLVEAMSLNLGVLSFDVPTNRYTTEDKALYFTSADELANILSAINDKEIIINRQSMKEIADRRYRWGTIANKYLQLI
jgi:glycosyltransferase involved in cell wall biosynthesis